MLSGICVLFSIIRITTFCLSSESYSYDYTKFLFNFLFFAIHCSLCSRFFSAEFDGVRGVAQSLFFCHEFREFPRIFLLCVFALRSLSSLFYSTPTGLWFFVDAFLVVNFDPFRVYLVIST
jgi:hypothetical protein